jgi:hypothetical protein
MAEVLGGGAHHRWSADIDQLDCVHNRGLADLHLLAERIEIHDHEVKWHHL